MAEPCRLPGERARRLPGAEHPEGETLRQNTANNDLRQGVWTGQPARSGCRRSHAGRVAIRKARWRHWRAVYPPPPATRVASPAHRSPPRRPAFARIAAVPSQRDFARFACSTSIVGRVRVATLIASPPFVGSPIGPRGPARQFPAGELNAVSAVSSRRQEQRSRWNLRARTAGQEDHP